ncbi:MAG TPA: M81 family metallopeptidase [Pseudomonadales bacterium]|jgi:microcystin degradation protein MlrC|nr:M81 family metallopeptidase [Pseudomonadales bacterium]
MKIAIAGLAHETNTFCRGRTEAKDFHQLRGERLFLARGTETGLGGALKTCEELGIDVVPVLFCDAQPSGIVARETYDAFKAEILRGIRDAMPLDGVFLSLHGAGVVEGIEDLEGDLCEAVRNVIGEAVPMTAGFDLHGNVTQRMADALDGVFACHQYPHIDMHSRAEEAIRLIVRMQAEGFRPVLHVEHLPMLLPTTTTFEGIGKRTLERMLAAESEPGVIDVSWFHGFPYTDVSHIGSYVVVTTEGDGEQARRVAKRLARSLWDEREQFRARSLTANEAVAEAVQRAGELRASGREAPVVINETSDNCGGGTPGDGTHLLRAMLEAKLERACFGFIVDADVAAQAHSAGCGATVQISLGGKYDDLHGAPIETRAYVKSLSDGRLVMQAMSKGSPLSLGPMARLVIDGIDVIVASRRSQTFDPEPFLAVGIDVNRYRIVALKSSNHFRAGFKDVAGAIVTADPPGLTTHHVEVFPRQRASTALWPMHSEAAYVDS